MRVVLAGLVASTLGLGGCASVVRGTDEAIAFRSTPPGATLNLSNGLQCPQTPCDLKVARKDEFAATFTKPGFKPAVVEVKTHLAGAGVAAGAGNILIGGAIGVGVDAYNGANMDHTPNPVEVTLQPMAPEPEGKLSKTRRAPVS